MHDPVLALPDGPRAAVKSSSGRIGPTWRCSYEDVKQKLQALNIRYIRYMLLFLAKLKVIYGNSSLFFDTAQQAW
ncbi:hypothetical protein NDU88_003621 [Pleurodeles waltl]|uniref:Uncharacterized protein n=1 Tax=Pleurodeles waltl TaxID=8319 RepID=A0AAV7PDN7_PLEWA|nr:hypothetical protein NDU88_003621 [Pleurodeles waltl]